MGTRAQFFIGDPRDVANREYLGCVAWDGYPDGDIGVTLRGSDDEESFRGAIRKIADDRDDFSDPAVSSFPFPWKDDLFLTDCTYALFDGVVQLTRFHRGFIPLVTYLDDEAAREAYSTGPEQLASNVPAPVSDKPAGTDSIMVLTVR